MIRPEIIVRVYQSQEKIISEVLAGIEEEGVLYQVMVDSSAHSASTLAALSAQMSQLEVGIGIFEREVCLTVHALRGEPLFKTYAAYRELGQNAARYVKGNRFTHMLGGEL